MSRTPPNEYKTTSGNPPHKSVADELLTAIRGDIYPQDDSSFVTIDYSRIFNGSVITCAKAVICPLDAEDVSRSVSRHALLHSKIHQSTNIGIIAPLEVVVPDHQASVESGTSSAVDTGSGSDSDSGSGSGSASSGFGFGSGSGLYDHNIIHQPASSPRLIDF
ncbi:hypothetical protein FIBSPDRAFT_963361 [Athelia psychrophila]|uniref:Uncharacterized protein n=1 Tax=Athelia psychrophila TaxID=1759441 RepID=A0A165Z360_9AGAM|nr:hypothetical protein FIBSPDRAFT_963361 [Fibularhizoctonia sp. CBS 109695]